MNELTPTLPSPAFVPRGPRERVLLPSRFHKLELSAFAVVLLVLNWTLLQGTPNTGLMFMPHVAMHSEWWRLFTHPFIHVTWWHLLLDGAAFLLLYRDLQEQSWVRRMLFCIGSAAGSLIVCLIADPMLSTRGLCGISGIAHGLMAVSALNLMRQQRDKVLFRMGLCSFGLVTLKCLIEAFTGKMFFAFLHFGMLGDPVAVTHAGGVLGALLTWLLCRQNDCAPPHLDRQ